MSNTCKCEDNKCAQHPGLKCTRVTSGNICPPCESSQKRRGIIVDEPDDTY